MFQRLAETEEGIINRRVGQRGNNINVKPVIVIFGNFGVNIRITFNIRRIQHANVDAQLFLDGIVKPERDFVFALIILAQEIFVPDQMQRNAVKLRVADNRHAVVVDNQIQGFGPDVFSFDNAGNGNVRQHRFDINPDFFRFQVVFQLKFQSQRGFGLTVNRIGVHAHFRSIAKRRIVYQLQGVGNA